MRIHAMIVSIAILLLASLTAFAQQPKDYLSVPGPVTFDKASYALSWTSHPTANYYKQEYLPAGEKADHYRQMLMLEVLTDAPELKDIVAGKMAELKTMKETNPVVNYQVMEKDGEYMLDFL